MIKIVAVALGLAQLRGCANSFCAALAMERYAARTMSLAPTTPQRVVDAAAAGAGALLLVSAAEDSPVDHERAVQRWSERGAEPLLTIRLRDVIGEGVAASGGGGWWYTVAGNYKNQWGALFITSSGGAPAAPQFVPLTIGSEHRWLALKGDVPAGLHLFRDGEETRVTEVTAEGVRRSWSIPGARPSTRRWWAANRLADGSIALASLETLPAFTDRSPSKVMIRILRGDRDETSYDEFVLENGGEAARVVSAVGRSGGVAVVVERLRGAIEAFLVDPRSGKSSRLLLSHAEEKARFPAVAATPAGFAVAWIDLAARPPSIRARSVERGSAGLVAVNVGYAVATPDREPLTCVLSDGEEDVFLWERSDAPARRRLPAELAGFELVSALKAWLCAVGSERP